MTKHYSIAEARHNLAVIVHELDETPVIELTRRGESVAMLLSADAYRRLLPPAQTFWAAYIAFREGIDDAELIDTPERFAGLRDPSPGREVAL
jgi:prevent-host-death family protein